MCSAVVRWQSSDGSQSANSASETREGPLAEPLRFSGPHFPFETALGPNPQPPCFACLGATPLGNNDARAGATVYACMRGAQGKNRNAAEALRKLGIKTVELDVSDDASVKAGVKKVLAEAGKIDVLVNNAGIGSAGVTEAFTAEQAKVVFDTNVIGLLRVTRAVLPSMRQKRDGLIVNIRSILRRVTFRVLGIYGASKVAVEALTDSLRYKLSQLGVEVVVL